MKLTCTGSSLHRAAAWTAKIAPTNPATPVMAGVLLDATDGGLTLSASDLETFGKATVSDAVVQQAGRTVVSARLLAAIAKVVPAAAEVTLVADGSRVEISSGRSRWKLPEMETDLWPQFPEVGDPIGKVAGDVLARGLDRVVPACGAPDAKPPILAGVLMEFGDSLTLTATDRYRIATVDLPWQPTLGEHEAIVIPATVLKHAATSGEVTISAENGVVGIQSGGYTVLGRLMAGQYPPVHSVIEWPKSHAAGTVTVSVPELTAAIDSVAIVLGDPPHLYLDFSDNGISVSPAAGDGDAGSEVDAIEYNTTDLEVKIKLEVIADALRCLGSDAAVFTFTDKNNRRETVDPGAQGFLAQPASADGKEIDGSYSHILMPMSKKASK